MSNTYEKLGQYATTELPIAPSNVIITAAYTTSADLSWTSNYSLSGTTILQLWMGNYWLTKNEIGVSESSGTITDLPESEAWRLRVAVLLNGVIYPAQPVLNSLPPIPYPTNLTYVGNDSNFVSTITWDGNDSSWEAIYIRAYIENEDDNCSVEEWITIATLTDTGATSYGISGYTFGSVKNINVGVRIAGEDHYKDNSGFIEVSNVWGGADSRIYLGGNILNDGGTTWIDWDTSKDKAKEIQTTTDNRFKFAATMPPTCGAGAGLNLPNYTGGTFTIRTNKSNADNRPSDYELIPADFTTLTGCENQGGAFKLTCGESIYAQYNIIVDLRNERSITITPLVI